MFFVRCDFKSFKKRNFHLLQHIYRCITCIWKEISFWEKMTAIQVRQKCLRKAALASTLSLSSLPSGSQLGKTEGWTLLWVSKENKRKKQKRMVQIEKLLLRRRCLSFDNLLQSLSFDNLLQSFTNVISSVLKITFGGKGVSVLNVLLW